MILFALIALLVLAGPLRVQDQGIHYEYWSATDSWHGEVMRQGDRVEARDYGSHGERHTCPSSLVGSECYTTCTDP
jgi:hypothetical protein